MVIWSAPATADLRSIHDFIASDFRHYAKRVVQDLVEKTDVLDQQPGIGRIVPELGNENIRELLPYSYRVIYDIRGNDVIILAVIHKRRNLRPEMINR